ncbi:hypothetical protein EEB13_16250 [Rhodococcus sp. WS3]|nr:hypothetical protein EEB13_16250 [Rhodococcus sp. WS3]
MLPERFSTIDPDRGCVIENLPDHHSASLGVRCKLALDDRDRAVRADNAHVCGPCRGRKLANSQSAFGDTGYVLRVGCDDPLQVVFVLVGGHLG